MLARTLESRLKQAHITLNGPHDWDIQVHDRRWFRRVLLEKNLGLGESYMEGWWDCPRIDEMICRLLRSGLAEDVRGGLRHLLRLVPGTVRNLQSRRRSRMVAERHYDLDNTLFLSFLDSNCQYSCGYFEGTDDLEQAQRQKLDLIARKLDLQRTDHLLDIGCGWGGLARFMAAEQGCAVTAVNISRPQLRHAEKICQGLPVTLLDRDYRDIEGRFDKIVSVGMFEHVGRKNYRTFMRVAHDCLHDEGIFLLHTIGGNVSRSTCDPWISRYIFPNGMIPSLQQICDATEHLFVIEDIHNLGTHYDRTLLAWNDRFQAAWPRLQGRYDDRFKRMWEYYLQSCAGAFRARDIQVWQIVMTRYESGRTEPYRRVRGLKSPAGCREA
jgi:cyclopropane-fatty-acyl-phospholipid synthase